jgi:exodeoxyribonuclease-3
VKIATWNVNGIRAREVQVVEWLARDKPDVVCLQELKSTVDQVPMSLAGMQDYWSFWHGAPKGYSGVSLHFRKEAFPDAPKFDHPPFDLECRIVQAKMGGTVFASVYVPNGGKDFAAKTSFMREMESYVAGIHAAGDKLVLCGDMNVALTDDDVHPSQRKPGVIGQRPEERDQVQRWIAAGVVDLGRKLDPDNKRLFTWWPPWRDSKKKNLGWRLDYVLVSEAWSARAKSCNVLVEVGTSDHAPVVAQFE